MYCQYCGSENAEENKFCEQCGKPLDVKPEKKTDAAKTEENISLEKDKSSDKSAPSQVIGTSAKKHGLLYKTAIFFLVLVLLIIASYFTWLPGAAASYVLGTEKDGNKNLYEFSQGIKKGAMGFNFMTARYKITADQNVQLIEAVDYNDLSDALERISSENNPGKNRVIDILFEEIDTDGLPVTKYISAMKAYLPSKNLNNAIETMQELKGFKLWVSLPFFKSMMTRALK